nr:PKD domain-containing protein [Candidatus Sigynarchaeota archaeon]
MRSHDTGRDIPVRRMNRWPWQRAATPLVLLVLASCVVTGTLIGLLARTGGVDSRNAGSMVSSGGIPVANFTANATVVLAGDHVAFTFTGDRGDEPCSFQWSFGDGSANATTENATHAYLAAGTFDVVLTVTDAGNETIRLAKSGCMQVLDPAVDLDGDWLTSGDEVRVYHTDPLNRDTDGDRFIDGKEVRLGKNPLDGASTPRPGDLYWTRQTGDLIVSSPAIADVDADGKPEVIVGSYDSRVYCLNGGTGAIKWSFLTGGKIFSTPAIDDVDGDGNIEVFIGSYDNKLYCFNGRNGTVRWSYLTSNDVTTGPSIADVDADGRKEVIFGSMNNRVFSLDATTGSMEWNYLTGGYMFNSPLLVDVNHDGILVVVIGTADCYIYCLSGFDGHLVWKHGTGAPVSSTAVCADVDADGELEIIIGSDDKNVYCLSALDGSVEWNYMLGSYADGLLSIADVNKDGILEVIAGSDDGKLYCITASNCTLKWSFSTGYGIILSTPAIADIDNDKELEIIVGSGDYKLYCLSGQNGLKEWSYPTLNRIRCSSTIGDVDGDGLLEIVAGSNDGKLYCLMGKGPKWAVPGPWSMFSGSPLHHGAFIDRDSDGLVDILETSIGTDPSNVDTDGDGTPDGAEISALTNPLDLLDNPAPRPPVPAFLWTPAAPVVSQPLQFTDTSFDIGGIITSRSWDFGDNTTGSVERNPLHVFAAAGTYTVTLTVIDNDNSTCTLARPVVVAQDLFPVANFTTNATSIVAGQSIAFTFTGAPGNAPATFQWSFGDGSPNATVQDPVHRYTIASNCTVQLTIRDANSDASTLNMLVVVSPVDMQPVASFHSNFTTSMGIGTSVAFMFDGSGGDGTPEFSWDFGDGTGSMDRDPVHAYVTLGMYNVTLTVTDANGDADTIFRPGYVIIIDLFPSAVFTTNVTAIMAGERIAFTFTGTRGDAPATFQW